MERVNALMLMLLLLLTLTICIIAFMTDTSALNLTGTHPFGCRHLIMGCKTTCVWIMSMSRSPFFAFFTVTQLIFRTLS